VGKTTLVRHAFPDYEYISLEDPVARLDYTRLTATEWLERYPRAALDEVQKAPSLVETVRAAYDASQQARYLLLGSSQILLLDRVRESLSGRAALEELWPLTLPEMATDGWEDPVAASRLLRWLGSDCDDEALLGSPATDAGFARARGRFERYLQFGAMPALQHDDVDDEERRRWLVDYRRTWLERDVADLAALRDLEPFTRAQQVLASRTGRAVNFSDLARSAGVAPATARRFLRYLELSYQVLVLPPWFRNTEKRLSKAPKVHFLDPGVLRGVTRRWGEETGEEFESAVVAEVIKQVRTAGLETEASWLRTYDGREVDLLLELPTGYVAFEMKRSERVAASAARHLRGLGELLDRPLLGSLVVSRDRVVRQLEPGIVAVPAAWLLGPAPP